MCQVSIAIATILMLMLASYQASNEAAQPYSPFKYEYFALEGEHGKETVVEFRYRSKKGVLNHSDVKGID